MIKALLIDDHPLIRAGLNQVFSRSRDIRLLSSMKYGKDVLRKVKQDSYDVIIMNVDLPKRQGLDYLNKIKKTKPDVPIIAIGLRSDGNFGYSFLKAGALGCLVKNCKPSELKSAIREVVKGKKYISPSLAKKIVYDSIEGNALHEKLSKREYEVMCAIASGKTLREIARLMSLSAKTISTNRARIMRKMKMKTNAELMRYAIKQELVD